MEHILKIPICPNNLLSVLLIKLSLDDCLKYNANTTLKNTFKVIIISQCISVLTDPI